VVAVAGVFDRDVLEVDPNVGVSGEFLDSAFQGLAMSKGSLRGRFGRFWHCFRRYTPQIRCDWWCSRGWGFWWGDEVAVLSLLLPFHPRRPDCALFASGAGTHAQTRRVVQHHA
jgi:hypothetical protein